MSYPIDDPLSVVIDFLEKSNNDSLASQVIDVFAARSTKLEQVNLIAKLYMDIRNVEKAEQTALRVLAMSGTVEEIYNARANLAKLYNHINEPTKSLFQSNINKVIIPDDPDTILESVFSLYLLNRKAEAEIILRELKSQESKLEQRHQNIVNFNLGTYDLEKGEFLKGLTGFTINGRRLDIWSNSQLPFKFWDGGIYPGKTLILYVCGGGIGDEMMFVRFMDDLKEAGFNPVFFTSRTDLAKIFNRCGFNTVTSTEGLPADSMWTYYMETPIYLECSPENIMRSKYLYPSQESRDKWSYLKLSPKLKIGVRWQGNSKNERDLHRKVPLDEIMQTLLEVYKDRDVEYYSLQIGDGEEEIIKYPQLIDVSDQIKSYDDTLAILENLDFVVTSCTSVLHASAIVGTKTYGLIPISAYFTWVSPAPPHRSIWYPDNLMIFKQVTPKKWNEPLAELKQLLLQQTRV